MRLDAVIMCCWSYLPLVSLEDHTGSSGWGSMGKSAHLCLSRGPKLSHWRFVCVQCGPGTTMPLPLWLLLCEEDLGSGSRNGPARSWILATSYGSGRRDETEGQETTNTLGCKLQAPGSLSVPPCHVVSAVNPSAPYEHSHFFFWNIPSFSNDPTSVVKVTIIW